MFARGSRSLAKFAGVVYCHCTEHSGQDLKQQTEGAGKFNFKDGADNLKLLKHYTDEGKYINLNSKKTA